MKLVKKGKPQRYIISGKDVAVVKSIKHVGNVDDAIDDIDKILDKHQEDIDKLKSNMKYIYSYGGVGGNGSGGSGGGQSGTPSLFVSLGGRQIQSGDNIIILNGVGTYMLEGNLSNSGGETFNLTVGYGSNIDRPVTYKLDSDRRWKITTSSGETQVPLILSENGEIEIKLYDAEWSQLLAIRQSYIVTPHIFDSKFMYKFNGDEYEFNKPYEYFIGHPTYTDPFVDVFFKISISNVSNIAVEYQIGDTDNGQGTEHFLITDITDNHFKIPISDLTRNGIPFVDSSNAGTYNVSVSLSYDVNAKPSVPDKISFQITLIPNDLYINVRNSHNVIYDSLKELQYDMNKGTDGIPDKNLTVGTYTSFYCKVYEGPMRGQPKNYVVTFKVYDYTDSDSDSDLGEFIIDPSKTQNEDGFKEQIERVKPINAIFETPGIKKLVFSTIGQKTDDHTTEKPIEKYIYIKNADINRIDWYPKITQDVFYFRANSADDTYSDHFPDLGSTDPLELSETSKPVILSDPQWVNQQSNPDATILSFGIQYSSVNSEGVEILRTYERTNSSTEDIVLYSDKVFAKKICIPSEINFNKSENSQYHLIQIVCCKIGEQSNNNPQYATYLYIDGRPESNKPISETDIYPLQIGKIVLNNVNIIYNLISIQYISMGTKTIDELIYQYYLAYKDRMVTPGEVTKAERTVLDNMSQIKFNGQDVIVDPSVVYSISKEMPIPTMMLDYQGGNTEEQYNTFIENLFKGYANASTEFRTTLVDVYWTPGYKYGIANELSKISIPPNITDVKTGNTYTGNWYVDLQGTSTMRNKIKNFSLSIVTANSSDQKNILVSPNYDSEDESTFLPESVWTLKADIADSAHANNTAVGKFVNENCTRFSSSNGIGLPADVSKYIKNTLEGFPFLMFFKVGLKVYYLGVYNFNMGRKSYYNLGYHTSQDTLDMISNIAPNSSENSPFKFSVGRGDVIDTLAIGEVRDNYQEFDFHQYDSSVLFQSDDSKVTKMFGKESDLTGRNAKSTLASFVRSVAKAGAYCYSSIGKKPVCSNSNGEGATSGQCVNRYTYDDVEGRECVPDVAWQFRYNNADEKVWSTTKGDITFDSVEGDIDNLLQCIYPTNSEGRKPEGWVNHLDFVSVSEYYTICMAFGLVDSILKNLNVKSWDGNKCYIAFYDMDCAFGENNAGEEIISYLAATDYWYSPTTSGYVEQAKVIYDYWNKSIGPGFDYTSSYLFAIAKYAQAICYKYNLDPLNEHKITLTNYPQQFWAKLRMKDGPLNNAKSFIEKYFSSGIGKIPTYLAALNYQVKYLYKGAVLDENDNLTEERFFANEHAFNGSRLEKVKDWMNKRLHFLDVMFNVQGISMPIGNNYTMPSESEEILGELAKNPDVVILSDAFSTQGNNTVIMSSNARPVRVWAPKNTPFVVKRGSSSEIYLLGAETGTPNTIQINVNTAEGHRFLGSTEFTDLNMVEPFITNAKQIYTNKLERIVSGSGEIFPTTETPLFIQSSSVKLISLPISTFKGNLNISADIEHSYGQSLNEIDVHDSGFTGSWENLKNLKKLNISSVNDDKGVISISQCPLLTGENCIISGDGDKPTTLNRLSMSGISGKFNIDNTSIETIELSSIIGSVSELDIRNDKKLKELILTGFKSIKINNCPNLEKLRITEGAEDSNKCETLIINMVYNYTNPDGTSQQLLINFNDSDVSKSGIFDFTRYTNLKTFGFSGCETAKVIKIPNHKVSIESFKNNVNLEFIDTTGHDSCIEITQSETFSNCPYYGMRQSWANPDGKNHGVNIKKIDPQGTSNKYTHMCIKPDTTIELGGTFYKVNSSVKSKYLVDKYINEWGQEVHNSEIDMSDAQYFINNVVEGSYKDDAYIGDGTPQTYDNELNIVYDTFGGNIDYGEDCRANITTLERCFTNQKGIFYDGGPSKLPDLSGYKKLTNVSEMYKGTEVTFISSNLLSFPSELNKNNQPLINWYNFIGSGMLKISEDAFKNISYRIDGFRDIQFSIYSSDPNYYNDLLNDNEEDGWFAIERILCPQENEEKPGEYIPFNRIKNFSSFYINSSQWVDYTRLFEFCPNVDTLNNFLNTDLSKSKINGILKPSNGLNSLTSIVDSFNHSGNVDDLKFSIDLYNFFDWNNENLYSIMTNLFTSNSDDTVGFSVKKYISNTDFAEILGLLHNFQKIEKLSNIFSYCTINDYDGFEIKLEGDMNSVKDINALFYNCKSSNDKPLKIRRSFFSNLKRVTSMVRTFYGVSFDHLPSYDFFCKCTLAAPIQVKVKVDGVIPSTNNATLQTVGYNDLISNMNECFCNAKFVGCRSWFDMDDVVDTEGHTNEYYKPAKDVVTYNGDSSYTTYYKRVGGVDVEYEVTNYPVTDTINNYTNYIEDNYMPHLTNEHISNHNIAADLSDYNNSQEYGYPYSKSDISETNISATYCCLPPDILYACKNDCKLTGVFADTNIIGVIPQHLLINVYNSDLNNMFRNTNILPNLVYHYNSNTSNNARYLELIENILPDEETIMKKVTETDPDYTLVEDANQVVLFRNSKGELRKRRPIVTGVEDKNGEYNKSIFVYIPQGYSTNTNLSEAFNFRYNLPAQVTLNRTELLNLGINWPEGNNFGNEYSPEEKPWLWPHYTQYFFMLDESILWTRLRGMSYPFISDGDDVNFYGEEKEPRLFSTSNRNYNNLWWQNGYTSITPDDWNRLTNGVMNIFLNLCGSRDIRTGKITDSGCTISKSMSNNVKLSSFVSGALVAFLNGRLFDSSIDAGRFTTNNTNSGKIINYDLGVGRNIIFPQLLHVPGDISQAPTELLNYNNSNNACKFYVFMFPLNSLENYRKIYNIRRPNDEGNTNANVDTTGIKYKLL